MLIQGPGRRLWFDGWVFLRVGQVTSWVLPPGHWLEFEGIETAVLDFEITGAGPAAAGGVTAVVLERTAAATANADYWEPVVQVGAALVVQRAQIAATVVLGDGGGLAESVRTYPLGRLRIKVTATGGTSGNWAAVRLRCYVNAK